MRPLSLLLPASLLALATAAGAQTMPYPAPDSEPITSVQISAAANPARVKSYQAEKITGAYRMSNGWRLDVRTTPRYIDASIDGERSMRLVQVAPYRFATGDGNVSMHFNLGVEGDDMEMSYVPEGRLAQRIVISSRLAGR